MFKESCSGLMQLPLLVSRQESLSSRQQIFTMLGSWLQMIFGHNGDKVVQKMQEWAQTKLDSAFEQSQSVSFLEELKESWTFYGDLDSQGQKQGKAEIVWNEGKSVLQGYFHDNHLVGNIHIRHLGNFCM